MWVQPSPLWEENTAAEGSGATGRCPVCLQAGAGAPSGSCTSAHKALGWSCAPLPDVACRAQWPRAPAAARGQGRGLVAGQAGDAQDRSSVLPCPARSLEVRPDTEPRIYVPDETTFLWLFTTLWIRALYTKSYFYLRNIQDTTDWCKS